MEKFVYEYPTKVYFGKEAVKEKLTGTVVKEIYVPGRIVNLVVK